MRNFYPSESVLKSKSIATPIPKPIPMPVEFSFATVDPARGDASSEAEAEVITVRRSAERGHFNHGWLDTYHTFSFDRYYDPAHMGFRSLRVINEDFVAPGNGFPTHGHRDMEIITYVLEGALEHKDSLGNGSIIRPGEVQRMSAGTGVTHSEHNPSSDRPLHLLQIWILPERKGIQPGYEQRYFPPEELRDSLRLIASRDGHAGSVTVNQDARIYAGRIDASGEIVHRISAGRGIWLQVVRGALHAGDQHLRQGDGASAVGEREIRMTADEAAEFLLFDLA